VKYRAAVRAVSPCIAYAAALALSSAEQRRHFVAWRREPQVRETTTRTFYSPFPSRAAAACPTLTTQEHRSASDYLLKMSDSNLLPQRTGAMLVEQTVVRRTGSALQSLGSFWCLQPLACKIPINTPKEPGLKMARGSSLASQREESGGGEAAAARGGSDGNGGFQRKGPGDCRVHPRR